VLGQTMMLVQRHRVQPLEDLLLLGEPALEFQARVAGVRGAMRPYSEGAGDCRALQPSGPAIPPGSSRIRPAPFPLRASNLPQSPPRSGEAADRSDRTQRRAAATLPLDSPSSLPPPPAATQTPPDTPSHAQPVRQLSPGPFGLLFRVHVHHRSAKSHAREVLLRFGYNAFPWSKASWGAARSHDSGKLVGTQVGISLPLQRRSPSYKRIPALKPFSRGLLPPRLPVASLHQIGS
jgi:hypothetical protein